MKKEIIGIIGGTGLGDRLEQLLSSKAKSVSVSTPFGDPSAPIMLAALGNFDIAFINRHGKGHKFSPSAVPYAANIYALKKLGVQSLLATGAVGSLREEIAPRDIVLVDQIIDKTHRPQKSFFDGISAVHVEMAHPSCSRLRKKLIHAASTLDFKTHPRGTYVCMEGPQFSTRAESLMHRSWGGDLIGMTAMPEAKLAREAQMCYTLIALASDYDCWRPHEEQKDSQTLIQEILGNLNAACDNTAALIDAFLTQTDTLSDEMCPCRKSLELAVWTAQDAISKDDQKKLTPLFE